MTVKERLFQKRRFHVPLLRESGHGPVVPGTMNRSSCLGQLMPVGRSHEQYFMTELKEKQSSRHRIYAMAKSSNTPSTHTVILALRGNGYIPLCSIIPVISPTIQSKNPNRITTRNQLAKDMSLSFVFIIRISFLT